MLFDTDVLVWVSRGRPDAARLIKSYPIRCTSVVSYMELIQGARNKAECMTTRRWLFDMMITSLPLSESIGSRAALYMEQFALSTAMDLADALIAATAVEHGLPLCTGNVRHFQQIRDLKIEPFRH